MTAELTQSVETALKAFNEYKGMVEGFKTKLDSIAPKMDAFDAAKFDALQHDIGKAIEESQAEKARAKALEDQQKLLEAELSGIKSALNRVPAGGSALDAAAEAKAGINKLFNQFARSQRSQKENFNEFLRGAKTPDELKALSVGTDPDGGYLTQPELGGLINTKVFESTPMRQLASVVTINTDIFEYILDNGEADGEWVGEGSSGSTETTPTLGKKQIVVHELAAKPKVTQKMLDDGIIDVESWLGQKVADIFARKEATAFTSGDGISKPRGILSYSAGTDIAQEQIEQVVSGGATSITLDGLINLQNALKEDYQPGATFLYKRATNAAVMLIKDGNGMPVFNMAYDKNAGLRPTLLGQPVFFGNDMPTVGANNLAVAYADFRRAYQIVDRLGVRVLRDPYTSKGYVVFYTTKRVGGAVVAFEAIKLLKVSA